MDSRVDRRQFLRQGLLLTGGALLLPDLGLGRTAEHGGRADGVVLDLLAGFSRNLAYHGASAAALAAGRQPRFVSLRGEVTDFGRLAAAFGAAQKHGVERVHATGSTFCLEVSGRIFEVDLQLGADFQAASAGAASRAIFAHDALSCAPAARVSQDPLNAGNALRFVRPSQGPAALGEILRGRADAAEAGLRPDNAFMRTEQALLAATSTEPAATQTYARVFVGHLSRLSAVLPVEEVAALASAPLIRSALRTAFGADFKAGASPAHSLADLLRAEIKAGRDHSWIQSDSLAQTVHAAALLREARKIAA